MESITDSLNEYDEREEQAKQEATETVERTMYIATRPVKTVSSLLKGTNEFIAKHGSKSALIRRASTFTELMEVEMMTTIAHVAVVVGEDYYHLKKMEDGTLALDITPFDPKTEFAKKEVGVTKATNAHIFGMALGVLSSMSHVHIFKKVKPENIPIYKDGALLEKSVVTADHSAFKSYYNPVDMQVGFRTGKYGAVNNCQRFLFAMLHQIVMHNSLLGYIKIPAMVMKGIASKLEPWRNMKELGGFHFMVDHYLNAEIADQ